MQKTNPWKNKIQQFHRDFLYFLILTVQGYLQRFGCENIINLGAAELTLYTEREAISPNFPREPAVPLGVIHFSLLQAYQFLQERCISVQSIRSCIHRSQPGMGARQPVPCIPTVPPIEQPQSALQRLTKAGAHGKMTSIGIGSMAYMG